jgi:hypothetical protein
MVRTMRRLFLVTLSGLLLAMSAPAPAAAGESPPVRALSTEGAAGGGAPPSRLQTMAKSFLIPGWGQRDLGHSTRAQIFFGADLAIWTAFAVFQAQGYLRKDSYIELAEVLGGVQNAGGADDEYYRNLGRFRSTADFMRDVRRDARARFGDDLDARRRYEAEQAVPPEREWSWESEADFRNYLDKRSDANRAFQNSKYMVAAAVLNRVLSAMDVARSFGASSSETVSFHVRPDPDDGGPLQLCLAFPLR